MIDDVIQKVMDYQMPLSVPQEDFIKYTYVRFQLFLLQKRTILAIVLSRKD